MRLSPRCPRLIQLFASGISLTLVKEGCVRTLDLMAAALLICKVRAIKQLKSLHSFVLEIVAI